MVRVIIVVYLLGDIATFAYLTFFDGENYSAGDWFVALPVNLLFAQVWPIYWLTLRPFMGV